MSWRDDPEIIWQDEDGDRLGCWDDFLAYNHPSDEGKMSGLIYAPETAAEWDELLHRLAAAAGRRIVGIEDAPRPIEVGDIVQFPFSDSRYEVRHVDGDAVMARDIADGFPLATRLDKLRHAEPAPESTVCAEDHRLCLEDLYDSCRDSDPDSGWRCSRSFGHDGPHVACATSMDEHNVTSWGGDL